MVHKRNKIVFVNYYIQRKNYLRQYVSRFQNGHRYRSGYQHRQWNCTTLMHCLNQPSPDFNLASKYLTGQSLSYKSKLIIYLLNVLFKVQTECYLHNIYNDYNNKYSECNYTIVTRAELIISKLLSVNLHICKKLKTFVISFHKRKCLRNI